MILRDFWVGKHLSTTYVNAQTAIKFIAYFSDREPCPVKH